MSEVPLFTHCRKVHAFDQESALLERGRAVYAGGMFEIPQIVGHYLEA